jgi:hypothetical protein
MSSSKGNEIVSPVVTTDEALPSAGPESIGTTIGVLRTSGSDLLPVKRVSSSFANMIGSSSILAGVNASSSSSCSYAAEGVSNTLAIFGGFGAVTVPSALFRPDGTV